MATTSRKATADRDTYLDLVAECPLRPIRTKTQHIDARSTIDQLAIRGSSLNSAERDYLDVLIDLVEAYEQVHFPMPAKGGSVPQKLNALMQHSDTSPTKLQEVLGLSQTAVSLILSGKRGLSKSSIVKLSRHFRLSADYFL
ncbi:MAG TPA: helix-turn-helix domain-containing protein [Tepidisphaeraceae bacterium]|nr:helix-turn-helix domain-containing protein [Tepidisphaeraceae bacterium]